MSEPTEATSGHRSPMGSLPAAFDFAMHQREFEINQLTQRNNFFMIFQGVLISGLVQSQGSAAPRVSFAVCILGFTISLLQVGMAAGSKYWQVRWERAAKTTEIWLLDSLRHEKRISSFLTADGTHLTNAEKSQLGNINSTPERSSDPLVFHDDNIKECNRTELHLGAQDCMRRFENWLILRKYSVSRIPIWVGIFLGTFWLFLLWATISFDGAWCSPSEWFHHIKLVRFTP